MSAAVMELPVPSIPPPCLCGPIQRALLAKLGIDVVVHKRKPRHRPPIIIPTKCPHSNKFWCEPTSEQIDEWTEDDEL
jgi:hypothetical protein